MTRIPRHPSSASVAGSTRLGRCLAACGLFLLLLAPAARAADGPTATLQMQAAAAEAVPGQGGEYRIEYRIVVGNPGTQPVRYRLYNAPGWPAGARLVSAGHARGDGALRPLDAAPPWRLADASTALAPGAEERHRLVLQFRREATADALADACAAPSRSGRGLHSEAWLQVEGAAPEARAVACSDLPAPMPGAVPTPVEPSTAETAGGAAQHGDVAAGGGRAGANVAGLRSPRGASPLGVVKTAVNAIVPADGVATFQLRFQNGSAAAVPAVLTDDWAAAGLDCSRRPVTATCASWGATPCPAPTAEQLQQGYTVPSFPRGGVLTLILACSID